MNNNILRKTLLSGFITVAAAFNLNAVPVHINSGNPAYPFPQFLEYTYGDSHRLGNIGTQNPEGVVHAEMEQEIRDAYQVHANEFAYTGEEWGGYKYIWTPYKSAYDCTEGDGYGLLAAAYMADMVTFNGYWMCTHDKRRNRSKSYSGCADIASDYSYGPYAIGDDGPGGNTAADGDVDVALALYVAYKQWGEFMRDLDGNIVNDACGNPISYKEAMIEVLRGLVAMSTCRYDGDCGNGGKTLRVNSGLIGLDGYPKGGDTWNEQTTWATANPFTFSESYEIFNLPGNGKVDVKGLNLIPEFGSGNQQHIDYNAPAYFREFYELFEELGGDPWEIEQFRRGEASSDWLIGKLIEKSQYSIPTAGWCTVNNDGTQTSFSNFNQGEDYRCSWRTIANYVWHGNPKYSWDPVSHKVVSGGNTYEYDAAVRMAAWMNDPSNWNSGTKDTSGVSSHCIDYGAVKNMPYSGPATIRWQNNPITGIPTAGQDFYCSLSMQTGMGSYAAVGAQDYELMGLAYRECNIKWDTKGDATDISVPASEECNVGKKSNYMHGWARQMGMMVLSGNYPAPSAIEGKANMKIYRAIKDSVTYCYTGDPITFLLSYRNYGSVAAEDVKIVEHVPNDFIFVSASNGGVYNSAAHTITWNVGKVDGFKSDNKAGWILDTTAANYKATVGKLSYICKAGPSASGRYCTTADITCSNGYGWTTNEYPNYVTATMQRNCVDVVKRSLIIEKSVDREKINPDNVATFTIDFENSSEAGWIDGGRPRVNFSWAFQDKGNQMEAKFRLFNDAIESYINYGNYRISYYLYDAVVSGIGGNGWNVSPAIYEGGDKSGYKITHEEVVEGEDKYGKWNQRLSMQFAPSLVTTAMLTAWNAGNPNCTIHKGGDGNSAYPLRVVNQINGNNYSDKVVWSDDWSYGDFVDDDEGLYYPISPSWQKLDKKGETIEEPVTKWLTCGCSEATKTVPNVLVEEYDGYVWRRILGNGPMAGRDVDSVYVRDTLPLGMEFVSFVGDCPLEEYKATLRNYKSADGRDIVEWFIPKMQVKQKGKIKYTANITFPSGADCQTEDEDIINAAWISAVKNSPICDTARITVTCAKVPDPIIPTTMTKISDKESYEVGDDITYTIGYKQTHGAIFDDAAKESSNWSLTSSSYGTSISNGTVSLAQGANAKFNYSYSSNIYVTADCKVGQGSSKNDAESIIYFRDNIRLGVYINYDGGGSTEINCYKGSTLLKTVTLASNKTSFNLKAELNGDIFRVWLDKDTTKLASFTVEGVPTTEGYFGFIAPGNGSCSFSNIYVHTDYAYDLSIIDLVPAEVIVDESSFESYHNGKSAGTGKFYKAAPGGGDQDRIEWTGLADNPIAFGDTFTIIWKGTVESCEESIINIASAQLLGHADDEIRAQAVSKCIDESCEGVEKAEISIKDAEICAGDSTVLTAVGTPKSSKYEYEFFLGNTSLGKASSVDTFVVKEMGDYKVKISDPSCPTSNPVTSKSVSLVVNALPDEEITDKAVICKNESLKLGNVAVEDHTIEWYGDINKTISVDAEDIPAEDVRNTYYYVLTDEATGCKGEVKEWDVVINDVPSTPTVKPEKELPLKDGVSENITNMASASGSGNYVVWYKDETAAIKDSVKAPILVDLSNEGKVTYYVREKSPEGCIGDIVPVSVVITSSQKPNPNDTTICVGEEIDVTTLVEVETGSSLIWYDENGNEITAPGLYSSNTAGVKEFIVAQTNGTAVSEKSTFSVTTVEVAKLKDDVINYCAGETAVSLKATVDDAACTACKTPTSYNWYIKGQPTSELIPATDVTASKLYSYEVEPVYEIAKGHTCVGEKASVEVNVEFVPAVMPDHAIHYTLSDAVGGKFPTLTEQDPTAVVPTTDKKLVWYDANENLIGETAPSPDMVTDDATVTYKVKQVSKNGCESEFQEVTVIITKTPIPTTTIAYYCDGETPDPIEQFASVTDNSYSLIWYDDDPKKGGTTLSSAPTIDVTINPGEVETVRKYYVAQGNATETSSANVVEVHIFAKPRLITRDSASCESPVDINGLWSDISKKVEFTTFYTALGGTLGQDELVTKSGTYRVEGGFNIGVSPNIKECRSEKSPIKIEVHSLGTVEIEGPDAVCPNTAVELKVSMVDEDIFDSTLTYVWNKPNNSTVEKEFLSDPIKQATTFSVTISDGACTKKYDKEVGINNGLIDGIIEISEADNDNSPVKMNASADGAKFHSCGGDVTILADVAGSDFVWQDGTTGNTVTKKGGVYKLTYKDANGCETGFAVEIVPNPIVDNTLAFDTTLCEGENVTLSLDITAGIETPDVVWKKDGTEISTDATIALKKVTTSEAGEYTYEATNRGCRMAGTFGTLSVLPRPTYTIKDVDVVCAGESEEIGLETLSPATAEVEWAPSPSLVSSGNTAVVTPNEDETYSFTISQNGGCKITEKISVKVAKPIDFRITTNDTTICENNVGNLKFGLKIVEGDVLSYEWKNEKDEVVSTSSVLKFTESEVGTYKYTAKLTSEACPSVTDDIEVAIVGVPLVDTVTKIDYHNVAIVPNENYGEAPYEYKIDANEFSTSEEAYVTYGRHTVVIKDKNGCMSSYEFVTEAPNFEIPTVVTPNGDGVNDAFISDVIAEAYPDAVVTIYDRYGKKLTEIKGSESWDGTYLGRKMPATDYWYEIWIDEIRKKYVGHFTLIND